jgi:acyl-CoA reductase-like NAD-dependent aldehyde dehydrogenase
MFFVVQVIPAIAAGCCIVLKPSELAPLSCLLLGELVTAAGLPKGALHVVSGLGGDAGITTLFTSQCD